LIPRDNRIQFWLLATWLDAGHGGGSGGKLQ